MKTLKTVGLVIVGIWMVWVSKEIIDIKTIAVETCGIAAAGGMDSHGGLHIPVVCPDLDRDEIKQAN
ncbi:MAG: hypothetical protein P4L57_00945 [Rhizomicrobium sp.]|nr:hypothetical protein [Rhizomicrobium sp.]